MHIKSGFINKNHCAAGGTGLAGRFRGGADSLKLLINWCQRFFGAEYATASPSNVLTVYLPYLASSGPESALVVGAVLPRRQRKLERF